MTGPGRRRRTDWAGRVAVILAIIAYGSLFTVHQTRLALVVRLGEPIRVVTEPGLNFKAPFIDTVISIDKRILDLENPSQEVIASDQKRLVVDAFARYRIKNADGKIAIYDPNWVKVGEVSSAGDSPCYLSGDASGRYIATANYNTGNIAVYRLDDTTGLPNRRAVLARLHVLLTHDDPFGVVLLDLDGFKAVNDTYGHETGNDLPWGQGGILVVKKPWPSMIRTIWGDPERFKASYYPEEFKGRYYLAGDGAIRDAETGYFTITGRIDDVLNVSGHRMGTMEIESALVSCTELVAEAAVVGRPDDTTGEAICAFVVLKRPRPTGDEAARIAGELRAWVAREIGPIAKPKDIRFGDNLPKTRSGKIMRRLLRARELGLPEGDISTLESDEKK